MAFMLSERTQDFIVCSAAAAEAVFGEGVTSSACCGVDGSGVTLSRVALHARAHVHIEGSHARAHAHVNAQLHARTHAHTHAF